MGRCEQVSRAAKPRSPVPLRCRRAPDPREARWHLLGRWSPGSLRWCGRGCPAPKPLSPAPQRCRRAAAPRGLDGRHGQTPTRAAVTLTTSSSVSTRAAADTDTRSSNNVCRNSLQCAVKIQPPAKPEIYHPTAKLRPRDVVQLRQPHSPRWRGCG